MKNLFKKTLACCLVVCMVLTLCISALTVNAEAVTGTVTVGTADITTADKTATVDVTVDANPLAAAEVVVNVPAGLTIAGLAFTADDSVEITYAPAANPTGKPVALSEATEFVAPDVVDGKFTYIIHLPANTTTANAVVLSITFAGTFAEGKIDVAVASAQACYDAESDLIALTFVPGAINVTAAHVCAPATTVEENRVEATCYAEGSYDEVVKCSCGEEISRTPKTIDKIAHTPAEAVVENNKAATCYAEGSYDSVVYCSVAECKHEISRTPVTVEKIAHTPAEAVEENRVEAKPGVAGSYDSVVYCAVEACKAEISRTPVEIPALPVEPTCDHDWEISDATPAQEDGTEGHIDLTCNLCGAFQDDVVVEYGNRLIFTSAEALYESEILLGFNSWSTFLNNDGSGMDNVYIHVKIEEAQKDGTIVPKYDTLTVDDAKQTVGASRTDYSWYIPVRPYSLNDNTILYAYKYIDGQWYNGKIMERSFSTYAVNIYNKSTTADSEKKVIANVLNYGSKAQLYFEYNVNDLSVDRLPDDSLVEKGLAEVVNYEAKIDPPETSKVAWAATQLFMESKTEINYEILISDTDIDVKDLVLEVWMPTDTNAKNGLVTYVHESVATEEQLENGHYFTFSRNVSKYEIYVANFSELDSRNFRNLIHARVLLDDVPVSDTKVYSIETRCAKAYDSLGTTASESIMYSAMMHYGDAALAHFGAAF